MRRLATLATLFVLCALPAFGGDKEEALFDAARRGDRAAVERLREEGVDLDARSAYGATALSFAADKGHLEVARYLVENGASVNVKDTFYEFTPLDWSLMNEHDAVAALLLAHGAEGADRALASGVGRKSAALVRAALAAPGIDAGHVARALERARTLEDAGEIVALLESAKVAPAPGGTTVEVPPAVLSRYPGTYGNDEIGLRLDVRLEEGKLVVQATGQPALALQAMSAERFQAVDHPEIQLVFVAEGEGSAGRVTLEQGNRTFEFPRVAAQAAPPPAEAAPEVAEAAPAPAPQAPAPAPARGPARNWPSFRGPGASGNGDGQGAPLAWDVEAGSNVLWKTPIPGIAVSSPIVWGERVFVTTAISGAGDETFRAGLYGDVGSVDDLSEHEFKVYALDRASGRVVWEQTSARAVPGAKRHFKASQANSTPATDGKRVVALFGSVGLLVAYDLDGKPLWRADLGVLDSGWFYDKTYQWGHASSPVIHDDLVIVQADVQGGSFLVAYRLADGKEAWRTKRDEIPSWGSPTVYRGAERDELVTNGKTIRGYDPRTGKELWRLGPNSEVTVATPIAAHGLLFVTAGYPPVRPVYAIRPGAAGDLTLPEGATSSDAIAWSNDTGGTYIPTPIVYGEHLYTLANNGTLTCYEATTGERVYRERVGGGGSFTASPVAADGRLYFAEEGGDVIVAQAGPAYEELARNPMGETLMATPAIADGTLIVRTLKHVYALGAPAATTAAPGSAR